MKILKNKLFIGIVCILAGLAVGFIALPKVQESRNEQIEIVKAVVFIEQGTQITKDMIETVSVDKDSVNKGILQADKIIDMYAVTNIYINDVVTASKASNVISSENLLVLASQKGLNVVSITLPSLAAGVSGRLMAGDIVTLMVTSKYTNLDMALEAGSTTDEKRDSTYIIPELKYLEVAMQTTNEAADAHVVSHPADDEKNKLPVTISFFVNEKQALILAELENNAEIHIAFVARGSNTSAFIPVEERVLNTKLEINTEVE